MTGMKLNDIPAWRKLIQHAAIMKRPEKHLKHLIEEKDRLFNFSLVELGKILATDIRKHMALKNQISEHSFDNVDPITKFYLEALFSHK